MMSFRVAIYNIVSDRHAEEFWINPVSVMSSNGVMVAFCELWRNCKGARVLEYVKVRYGQRNEIISLYSTRDFYNVDEWENKR